MKIIINGQTVEMGGGVPPGGASGQVLAKASDADYDVQWVDGATGEASGGETYSTEETRIGTWIDGKPIYRIVINVGNALSCLVPQLNIDWIVAMHGQCYISAWDNLVHIPFFNPSSNISMDFTKPSNLRIAVGGEMASVARETVVTLEYTKTTDQPPAQINLKE